MKQASLGFKCQAFASIKVPTEPEKSKEPSRKTLLKKADSLLSHFRPKRELIAGGDIRWKPVNKEAAMLLARSPEINKPKTTMTKEKQLDRVNGFTATVHNPCADTALGRKMIDEANKLPERFEQHVEYIRMARASLDIATDMFRRDMIEFCDELPKNTEKIRQWRMMVEREKDLSLKALKDLRQFFLDKDYETEMQRLSEFVRMAERLAALAKDGTLDAVSSVMLKMA